MKKLIYILMFILLINLVYSATIEIDIEPYFTTNDQIQFDYTIKSDQAQIISYYPFIECPNFPIALIDIQQQEIFSDEIITATHYDVLISESIESQKCTASITIAEPYEQVEKKEFEIVVKPSFVFDISLSKKIFLLDEEIKIDYDSEVKDPEIKAVLTFPNEDEKEINLPYTSKAEKIGAYNLKVTASKEDYKTQTIKESFGVIAKDPKIKRTGDKTKKFKIKLKGPILYMLIITIVIIISILYYIFKKKDKGIGKINEYNYTPPQRNI